MRRLIVDLYRSEKIGCFDLLINASDINEVGLSAEQVQKIIVAEISKMIEDLP